MPDRRSVDRIIQEASKHSSTYNWSSAYGIYKQALAEFGNELSGPDLARLHNEAGLMAQNYAKDASFYGMPEKCVEFVDLAHMHYDAAITSGPTYWRPFFNMGNLLGRDQGRLMEALEYFEKAAALNPSFADIHNNQGITHAQLGHRDAARECFFLALAADPNNSDAQDNLDMLDSLPPGIA